MNSQQHSVTLSQLSLRSEVSRRTLQLWTTAGVLQAEAGTSNKGTGVHRRWPPLEVEIAAVLGDLERYGLTVGTLHGIAAAIRASKRFAFDLGLETPKQIRQFLNDQIAEENRSEGGDLVGAATDESLNNWKWRPLLNWLRWQEAKGRSETVFMRLAVAKDQTWTMSLVSGDDGFRLDWGDERTYFVVKLSKILRGL
jgi:hypothetical protein